ncbi:hypothetical protein [Cellulosimicrobium cellulans]|nr:hypothetical protein [Cellulosimicrobium cellulans]
MIHSWFCSYCSWENIGRTGVPTGWSFATSVSASATARFSSTSFPR